MYTLEVPGPRERKRMETVAKVLVRRFTSEWLVERLTGEPRDEAFAGGDGPTLFPDELGTLTACEDRGCLEPTAATMIRFRRGEERTSITLMTGSKLVDGAVAPQVRAWLKEACG